jgi:hypothetical protein
MRRFDPKTLCDPVVKVHIKIFILWVNFVHRRHVPVHVGFKSSHSFLADVNSRLRQNLLKQLHSLHSFLV